MADLIYGAGGSKVQVKTMPTPSASKFKKIVEYVGETTSDYTKGYFYECYISGTTPAVQEAFTVTQTAGSPIEEITTSVSVFKNKVHPTGNMNVQFTCAGKPTQVKLTKEGENLILDRYTPFDNPTQNNYCWKSSYNNFYYSHTELPVASTRFYLSSVDPSVPSTTDSGWDYNSTTGRASTGQGVWVKDAVEYVTLSDYGIYLTGTGQISDVLQVAYVYPVPAGNTYAWRRINVQPAGGGAGGVNDVRIDNTSIVVNEIANIPTASTSQKGLVKVDGTTITINNGVISGAAQGANQDLSNLSATGEAHFLKSSSLKTVNNNSLVGSGNISIKTYSPFPSDFVTSGTLAEVVASIKTSSGRGRGNAYLGTISGACMPYGSGNGECKVEYMTDNIAVLTLNSSNTPPYNWVYNTDASNLNPADYTWKHYIPQYGNDLPTRDVPDGTIVQYAGETNANYTKGYFYKANTVGYTCTWERWDVQPSVEVINNVQSTATASALSANMGKELQDQITNLKNIGRFLALWNSAEGKPETEPVSSGEYLYRTGDYYRVGTVATGSGTNYKPDGSSYTHGQISTTVETETVEVGAVYYYDGSVWRMQAAGGGGLVQDVQINGTTILDLGTGIANIPIASENNLGVVKVMVAYGIDKGGSGQLTINKATDSDIVGKSNTYKPIVSSNLDKAVMEGLGNNSLTWSEQYKTNARNTIGAGTQSTIKYWS